MKDMTVNRSNGSFSQLPNKPLHPILWGGASRGPSDG